jgi:pyrimidine operon attenuation protein/uracil phosphoribosyltransferase
MHAPIKGYLPSGSSTQLHFHPFGFCCQQFISGKKPGIILNENGFWVMISKTYLRRIKPVTMSWVLKRKIMDEAEIARRLERMTYEIREIHPDPQNLLLVGIRTRGVYLAERLKLNLDEAYSSSVPLGAVDITLYRDDLSRLDYSPVVKDTELPFNLDDKNILLVDDVLYTGRTIRAAMDAIFDFGRPKSIQLAVLVDRGHRELPIQADFVGKKVPTASIEQVQVKLVESDAVDEVVILEQSQPSQV